MRPVHVLVLESGSSLLEEGVASILKGEFDLQVSGLAFTDEPAFVEQVAHLRPDVILMNAPGLLDSARIVELLKDLPTLATLRVICVRPNDNTIDVYERRQITAVDDLFTLIRRGDGPGC
jgi:hypothetical protein